MLAPVTRSVPGILFRVGQSCRELPGAIDPVVCGAYLVTQSRLRHFSVPPRAQAPRPFGGEAGGSALSRPRGPLGHAILRMTALGSSLSPPGSTSARCVMTVYPAADTRRITTRPSKQTASSMWLSVPCRSARSCAQASSSEQLTTTPRPPRLGQVARRQRQPGRPSNREIRRARPETPSRDRARRPSDAPPLLAW